MFKKIKDFLTGKKTQEDAPASKPGADVTEIHKKGERPSPESVAKKPLPQVAEKHLPKNISEETPVSSAAGPFELAAAELKAEVPDIEAPFAPEIEAAVAADTEVADTLDIKVAEVLETGAVKVAETGAVKVAVATPAAHPDEGAVRPGETPMSEEIVSPLSDDLKPGAGISWFAHLKKRLIKTRHTLKLKLEELIGHHKKIDGDFMEGLEEILISSDLGIKTTQMILSHFEEIARIEKVDDAEQLMDLIKEVLLVILDDEPKPLNVGPGRLNVILMIGVNGVGKTTTIGKLAARYAAGGKKVILAAGDTFRAGAIEQIEVWGHRAGCEVISYEQGGDAGAVVYDGIQAARSRGADILIIDTAGRLHNKFNLMEELKKVRRVIAKELPDAPHETLLVLDANTGQNGIAQAKVFRDEMGVTGIVLTKIDGTAKGGVTVAIREELKLPVKLIGIGEKMNDLRVFNPKDFIQALLEE